MEGIVDIGSTRLFAFDTRSGRPCSQLSNKNKSEHKPISDSNSIILRQLNLINERLSPLSPTLPRLLSDALLIPPLFLPLLVESLCPLGTRVRTAV